MLLVKTIFEARLHCLSLSIYLIRSEHFGLNYPENMNASEIARRIDSTNLKLNSTDADLCTLCDEAAEYGFATVCIYPADVTICSTILYNTPVKVCTVIGFPMGAPVWPLNGWKF